MKRAMCAALAAMVSGALPAAAQIFTENFDDGAAATRWSAPIVDAETGVFDGNLFYDWDYVSQGIPLAPGGGGGKALFVEVNITDQTGGEGESVAILANGLTLPAGDFKMSMDVWFNVESANGGSTEFGIFGVHAAAPNDPTNAAPTDDVPFQFAVSNGNGLAWMASGDSGAAQDIVRYADANNANAGTQTNLGNYDSRPPIPGLADQSGLGPRNSWVEIGIERTGSTYVFSMNGAALDTFVDAGGVFDGGTIMLGYNDAFNSVGFTNLLPGPDPTPFDPSDGPYGGDDIIGHAHFILIDNVVLVPEPASALLALIGIAGLASRRR